MNKIKKIVSVIVVTMFLSALIPDFSHLKTASADPGPPEGRLPEGQIGCITDEQEPGIICVDNHCDCPNDREGCVSIL